MKAKPRTRAKKAQPETLPILQPTDRPILVKDSAGVIHTHYLSIHGAQRIDALTAGGMLLNDAIGTVVPGYVTPYTPTIDPAHIPECITMLSLGWPCTVADVKRRYHELSFKHHPDQGGSSAEFVIVTRYYEEAMAYLGAGLGGAI